MAVVNVKNRIIWIVLFVILQATIFWLGRFSAQLSALDNNLGLAESRALSSKLLDKENDKKPSTFLMIAIMTAPGDSEQRQLIRDTWLKLSTKTPQLFRHFFPIGTKGLTSAQVGELREEEKRMALNSGASDLVLLDEVVEDYRKLSRKTAASIRYAVQNFDFEFLLKVDSDSFVRLGTFLGSLRDVAHPRLYWGFLDGRAKPFRKGKWKEPEWILCDRYLPYQLGGGYVLSRALSNYISENFQLLRYYGSEDVAVGAWIAGLDVKYVHDPRFDTEFTSRGCHNEYLITHKQSGAMMRELYDNVRYRGVLCTTEARVRPSYIYDFSAPPSQCCLRKDGSSIP